MRAAITLAMLLSLFALTSRTQAQVTFSYGGGALPLNSMQVSTIYSSYPGGGLYGDYPAQNYYGGYPSLSAVGTFAEPGGFTLPYGASTLQPINGLYPAQASARNPIYGNYARYSQFGYRRYGSGRMFGSYIPRVYTIYQPRMGGVFDR